MNRIKIAKMGYILISVIFCVTGLIYLILPEISVRKLCYVGGIVLIIYGIIKIIGYFSSDLDMYCLAFQYDLGCGLFLIIIGIIVMIRNANVQQYLSLGLGILILLDSMLKIQTANDAHIFGLERWYLILILSVIAGIFGILIILTFFVETEASHTVNGIGILAEGLINYLFIINTVRFIGDLNLPKEIKNEHTASK